MTLDRALLISIHGLGKDPFRTPSLSYSKKKQPPRKVEQRPRIFIACSHEDAAKVLRIKEHLIANGFSDVSDSQPLAPSDDIKSSIDEAVGATEVTISVVSITSLLVTWLAQEAASSQGKRFIACYIDDDYLKLKFKDQVADHTASKLGEIGEEVKARIDEQQRPNDLIPTMDLYRELQSKAVKIVRQLRDTGCIDLREELFEDGLRRLLQTLKE